MFGISYSQDIQYFDFPQCYMFFWHHPNLYYLFKVTWTAASGL